MKSRFLLPLVLLCAAAAPTTQPLPARLGVNIHFTKPQPGEIKMMADAGVNTIRMDFAWAGTEREKGKYDFGAYDGLLAALDEHHIDAVFILDYANKFYDDGLSPHTDAGREAFAKWAAAAVMHFKGRNIIWEMYNEPNIQFWKPKPNVDDYAKLAIATGKAIRAADANATYVGPASSTIDLAFLESCFKAGCLEYWDAVSVHPYRQSEPETVAKEYRELRHLIAKYAPKNKQIPIYSGEWGYSAAWSKYEEEKQALYLPRQWLTNIMNDVPLSIWYDWHDDGRDPKEPEHHFGTVQNEKNKEGPEPWKPKLAYLAMKTFNAQLRGFLFAGWLDLERRGAESRGARVMLFARKDGNGKPTEVRAVAWTDRHETFDIKISSRARRLRTVDHLGNAGREYISENGSVTISISDAVQYLVPDGVDEHWLVAAAWQRVPLETMVRGGGFPPLAFTDFMNPLDRPLTVTWSPGPAAEQKTVVLPPGGHAAIPNQGAIISRDSFEQWVASRLKVEGLGEFTQLSLANVTNPIDVNFLETRAPERIVRIDDVTGEGFKGFIKVSSLHVSNRIPLTIPKGQRIATIAVPLLEAPADGNWYDATLVDAADESVADHTVFGRTIGAFAASPLPYKAVADGDRKVKSEQSIRTGDPKEGPIAKGVAAIELSYRFEAGHKFVQVMPTTDDQRQLGRSPRELTMWVFGDGSGHLARCRVVDSTGQVFQPNGVKITWTGWKLVSFPLGGNDNGHWGGKNDGEMHYPLKLDTLFLLDNASKQASEGKIYIASPMTVE